MERLLRSVCRPRRIRKSSFVSTTPLSRLPLSIHSSTNPERTPLRLFAIVEWFLTLLPRPFRAIISLGRGQLVVAIWPYYSPLRRRRRRNDLERKYCAEQALREKVKIQRSLHSVRSRIRPKCKGTERPTDGEERISFADVPHSVSLFCIMKNLHPNRRSKGRNLWTSNGSSTDDATIFCQWFCSIRQMQSTPTHFPFLRKTHAHD